MLMLSRRPNEAVRIGDNVTVRIITIRGNQVKLGFDAPPSLSVHREEIYQKIKNATILGQSDEKQTSKKETRLPRLNN